MPQAEMHVVTEPTLEERALSIVEDAKLIIVKTGEDYVRAGDFIKLKADPLIEEIKGKYNPRIEQAHTLHKGLIKDRDGFLQQPVEAKSYLRSEMIRYDQEQDQKTPSLPPLWKLKPQARRKRPWPFWKKRFTFPR